MTILTLLDVLWKRAWKWQKMARVCVPFSPLRYTVWVSEKGLRSVLVITCPVCDRWCAIYSTLRGYCVSGAYAVTGAPVRTDAVHLYLCHCTPTPPPHSREGGGVWVGRVHTCSLIRARSHSHKHVPRQANKSGSSWTLWPNPYFQHSYWC